METIQLPNKQMKAGLLSDFPINSTVAPRKSNVKRIVALTSVFAVCAVAATIALSISSQTTTVPSEASRVDQAQTESAFAWPWSSCPVAPALSSVHAWAEQLLVALPQGQPSKAPLNANQPLFGRFFHTTSPGCIQGATFEARPQWLVTKHSTVPAGKEQWVNGAYVNNWKGQPVTDAEFAALNYGIFRSTNKLSADLRWSNAVPGSEAKKADQRGLALKIRYGSENLGHRVDSTVVSALGLNDLVTSYGLTEQLTKSVYNTQEQDIIMSTAQFFPASNDQLASDLVVAIAAGKFSSILGAVVAVLMQSWSALTGSSQNPLKLLGAANDSGDTDKNLCARDPFTSTHFSQSVYRIGTPETALNDLLNPSPNRGTYVRYKLAPCEEVCQRFGCDSNCLGHATARQNMKQSLLDHFTSRPTDPVCFNLYVQVAQADTCLEDATAIWNGASYYKVANVTFEKASLMDPAVCEQLTFNPFNGLMEHLPIGLNRMRFLTYLISQQKRLTQPGGPATSEQAAYRSA